MGRRGGGEEEREDKGGWWLPIDRSCCTTLTPADSVDLWLSILPLIFLLHPSSGRRLTRLQVLQQAPAKAILAGSSWPGTSITVSLTPPAAAPVSTVVSREGYWQVELAPVAASFQAYTVTAESQGHTAVLQDVLFGDVWVRAMRGWARRWKLESMGRCERRGVTRLFSWPLHI